MISLAERTALHVPELHVFEADGITYAVDAEAPNWIATDERGSELLRSIGQARAAQPLTFGGLVASYASRHALETGKAWLHVHDFLAALGRASMLFDQPVVREPYAGRAAYVEPNCFHSAMATDRP